MPTITSRDGQLLNHIDIGPRSAPVCILVHGFGMQASFWLPLVLPLAAQYRFILPDLRGFGGSINAAHQKGCVFTTFADDLDDLISALDLSDIALAGFSMGGMSCMMYQRLYGTDKLRAYLQIDQSPVIHNTVDWPWGLYGSEQDKAFAGFHAMFAQLESCAQPNNWQSLPSKLRQLVRDNKAAFVAGTVSKAYSKACFMALHKSGLIKNIINHKNWDAYLRCMRSYMQQRTDLRDVFDNYDIPLWVFAGGQSELYSVHGQRRLAELVNYSTLVEFPRNGHALPYENPIKFLRNLSVFIATAGYQDKESACLS